MLVGLYRGQIRGKRNFLNMNMFVHILSSRITMVENKRITNPLYLKDYTLLDLKDFRRKSDVSCYIIDVDGEKKVAVSGSLSLEKDADSAQVVYILKIPSMYNLGDKSFKDEYNTRCSYYAGGMAHGISSANLVIALGKNGFMGSYGSGGMSLDDVKRDIDNIKKELPMGPFIVNFLHIPNNDKIEFDFVNALIEKGIKVIEASAFIDLSPALLYYRISGLSKSNDGKIGSERKIIAKISREEIAIKFMSPPDLSTVNMLLKNNLITREQAELSLKYPIADDITVEADSGGHTDSRPLVSLLPSIIEIRDAMQSKFKYDKVVRIGAAGGISTPEAALCAFSMGASYVVTGSINQACMEAGTSDYVKDVLSKVTMADVAKAPCADMFEMGAKVQVVKKGTMYPLNAQRLYDIYIKYKSIDEIPEIDKNRIEKNYFKASFGEIWEEVKKFFTEHDPKQLDFANKNPKFKMALIFRWYLGNSSRWSISGDENRKMDMQIWCGPSMGAFNNFARGTYLEDVKNRKVSDVATAIMEGCAHLSFNNTLKRLGVKNLANYEFKPKDYLWNLDEIIEMTANSMSKILGPRYKKIDQYRIRARLPLPPFLFVTRVTKIDAEFGKFKPSSIEFEFDVTNDCIFTVGDQMSHIVASEASHIGIFLVAYMGIDEISNGTLAYRIVDTKSTFYSELPRVGETFKGIFELKTFLKQGPTTLVIFNYKCFVGDRLVLMIDAIGGFFTKNDLDGSKGIIEAPKKNANVVDEKMTYYKFGKYKESYSKEDLNLFYDGLLEDANLSRENFFIDESIRQIDRITHLSDTGGKYGQGQIIAEKDIDENYWAFKVHFVNDPVFPVSLIFEGINQIIGFLILSNIICDTCKSQETKSFEPLKNITTKGSFRGQIRPSKCTITYKIYFKKFDKNDKDGPYCIFDADVYCDSTHIVKIEDLSVCLDGK